MQEINTSVRVRKEYLEVQITELNSKVRNIQLQGEKKQVARGSTNQNINSVVNTTESNGIRNVT